MQRPKSQEYPKRILGKSDVYQVYDSVHKKESPIIMSNPQERKARTLSFAGLVLEPELWMKEKNNEIYIITPIVVCSSADRPQAPHKRDIGSVPRNVL
jgi:hypothetical protein